MGFGRIKVLGMGVILFQQIKAMLDGDEDGFKNAQTNSARNEGERNP